MIRLQSSFRIHKRYDHIASPDEMRLNYQVLLILSPLSFFLSFSEVDLAEKNVIGVGYQSLLTLLDFMWQKWRKILRYRMNNTK